MGCGRLEDSNGEPTGWGRAVKTSFEQATVGVYWYVSSKLGV